MAEKGTSHSEAVVFRKFSRRRWERRELPLFCFLFSLITLRMWIKQSEDRGHWCSSAHTIFSCTSETKLLLDLWSRPLLLNLFHWEETWLQSSFFPATESFWTAGEKQQCGDRGPQKIRKRKFSVVDNGTKFTSVEFTYPLPDVKKELEESIFDLWLLSPVHTSMPIPAQFVVVNGVPPLQAGWGWSMALYFCLFVSLSGLLALFLWFLFQQSQHYRNRK